MAEPLRRGLYRRAKDPRRKEIDTPNGTESDDAVPSTARRTRSAHRNSAQSRESNMFLYELWGIISAFFWKMVYALLVAFKRPLHAWIEWTIIGVGIGGPAVFAFYKIPKVNEWVTLCNANATHLVCRLPFSSQVLVLYDPHSTEAPKPAHTKSADETSKKFKHHGSDKIQMYSYIGLIDSLPQVLHQVRMSLIKIRSEFPELEELHGTLEAFLKVGIQIQENLIGFDGIRKWILVYIPTLLEDYEKRLKETNDPPNSVWRSALGRYWEKGKLQEKIDSSIKILVYLSHRLGPETVQPGEEVLQLVENVKNQFVKVENLRCKADDEAIKRQGRGVKTLWTPRPLSCSARAKNELAAYEVLCDRIHLVVSADVKRYKEISEEIRSLIIELRALKKRPTDEVSFNLLLGRIFSIWDTLEALRIARREEYWRRENTND